MIKRNRPALIALVLCAILALSTPTHALQITKQLTRGVTLYQEINIDCGKELIVNAITVDPAESSVSPKAALGCDLVLTDGWAKGREAVSSITARKGAVAGVNADFFPFTGDPLGVGIIDGELVSEPGLNRAALTLLKNGRVFFDNPALNARLTLHKELIRQIDGINRPRGQNQIVAFTEVFGASTNCKYVGTDVVLSTNDLPIRVGKTINLTVTEVRPDALTTPIPKGGLVLSAGGPAGCFLSANLKPGDSVSIRFDLKSPNGVDWTQVEQAVGGGPWLVKNGSVFIDAEEESFQTSMAAGAHPRTAVGFTADNKLLLVTVDGRQSISRGVTLSALADIMKRLGAVNAINLDGGGSTTMASRGIVMNSPCEGMERPVANALLVFGDQPATDDLPKLAICGIEDSAILGQGTQLYLTWGDEPQSLTQDQLARVVWGTTGGIGFVNQAGYFVPTRAGKGTITALHGSQRVCREITVSGGQSQ